MYIQKHPAFPGDTLIIVEPFSINENKVLSMTAKRSIDGGGFDIVKQQVPLNRINRIMKDINVILGSTEEDVVATSTSISADGGTETFTGNSDMFFLQLASRLQGEDWQLDIAKAFAKAGYAIKKDYWAD